MPLTVIRKADGTKTNAPDAAPAFKPRTLTELISGRSADDTPGYRAAVAAVQKEAKGKPYGPLQSFGSGLMFGFNDEASGLGNEASTWIAQHTGQKLPYTPEEMRRATVDVARQTEAQYRHDHPVASTALTVAGAVAAPGGLSGARLIARGATGAARVARAAGVGAAQGAAYGAGNTEGGLMERAKGAGQGAAVGAAAGSVLQAGGSALVRGGRAAAARLPSPARLLSQAGVTLTPGQMSGGIIRQLEDGATHLPILGPAIVEAKNRTIDSFNRVALNRVLAPVGEQLPADVNVGRDGLRHATARVSAAYDRALAPVNLTSTPTYEAAIDGVVNNPRLPQSVRQTLGEVLDNTVRDRVVGQPSVTGDAWKAVDSELGAASRAANSASAQQPAQRYLARALDQIRAAHFDLLHDAHPQAATAVRDADTATANLVRVRKAATATGAARRAGAFLPSELNNAVKATDTSAGKRDYATAGGLLQDLTDPAMQVLPSTVGDSGTASRGLISAGIAGAAGGGLIGKSAEGAALTVGGLGAGAAAYSPIVQDAVNAVYRAATPGQARVALGNLADLASRYPAAQPAYDAALRQLRSPSSQQDTPAPQLEPMTQ